ncbi:universal stress protein [Pelagibius litoralis]|uniref:Universal stress protein n=1 Tax=Pelagibius litoralis TaxID=374515 RepID=A0A967K8H0_9PROT|nr:universal stress protein [Pelagibius litoralis]NIA69237.1 universal stress protein [Pelagibius litoralis]
MTVRTILVPVRGDGKGEGVLDYALSLARRHQAHLEVLHCRPRPDDMIPFGVFVPARLRKEIVTSAGTLANEEESKVRDLFDRYCAKHDIPEIDAAPWPRDRVSATWREETGKQAKIIGLRGRLADLIAVAKPDHAQNLGLNTLEAALLETGKLVLMCPPRPVDSVGAKVAIAWNGSGEAARAVTAALPLLTKADSVILLAGKGAEMPVSAEEAKAYLAVHDIDSALHSFSATPAAIGQALLSNAKEAGADCLLMGAYGQSRRRELVMGGVTQHVIDHADMPILLMH